MLEVYQTSSEFELPSLAVLQPLTLASATLTYIKSDINILVEKLVAFSARNPSVSDNAENATCNDGNAKDLKEFVANTVKALCPQVRKKRRKQG